MNSKIKFPKMFVSNWDEPIKSKLVYKEKQERKDKTKKKKKTSYQNLKNYRMRYTRKTGNHHRTTGRIIFKDYTVCCSCVYVYISEKIK